MRRVCSTWCIVFPGKSGLDAQALAILRAHHLNKLCMASQHFFSHCSSVNAVHGDVCILL